MVISLMFLLNAFESIETPLEESMIYWLFVRPSRIMSALSLIRATQELLLEMRLRRLLKRRPGLASSRSMSSGTTRDNYPINGSIQRSLDRDLKVPTTVESEVTECLEGKSSRSIFKCVSGQSSALLDSMPRSCQVNGSFRLE